MKFQWYFKEIVTFVKGYVSYGETDLCTNTVLSRLNQSINYKLLHIVCVVYLVMHFEKFRLISKINLNFILH